MVEAWESAGQSMTSAVLLQYFSLLSFVAGELECSFSLHVFPYRLWLLPGTYRHVQTMTKLFMSGLFSCPSSMVNDLSVEWYKVQSISPFCCNHSSIVDDCLVGIEY